MSPQSRDEILPPAPRWTWRAAGFALLATAGLFMLLPMLERAAPPDTGTLALRELERAPVPPPRNPPPPPPEPEAPRVERLTDLPEPRLDRPPPEAPPMRLPVDLRPSLGDVKGDFRAEFTVSGDALTAGLGGLVFEISDLDKAPVPVARVQPMYPPQARLRRIEGEVTVEFVVGVDGTVEEVTVTDSRPSGVFDRAVERAVRGWKFRPGEKGGRPVPTRVRQRIDFTLE